MSDINNKLTMNARLKTEELHKKHKMCFTWKRLTIGFGTFKMCFGCTRWPQKHLTGTVHQLRHAVVSQYVLKLIFRPKKDFKLVFKNV